MRSHFWVGSHSETGQTHSFQTRSRPSKTTVLSCVFLSGMCVFKRGKFESFKYNSTPNLIKAIPIGPSFWRRSRNKSIDRSDIKKPNKRLQSVRQLLCCDREAKRTDGSVEQTNMFSVHRQAGSLTSIQTLLTIKRPFRNETISNLRGFGYRCLPNNEHFSLQTKRTPLSPSRFRVCVSIYCTQRTRNLTTTITTTINSKFETPALGKQLETSWHSNTFSLAKQNQHISQ